jgi:hypothetical protein
MNPTNSQQALAVLAQSKLGQLPAAFRDRAQGKFNDDLAGGITAGFAILSMRGKVWRIKHHGEEHVLLNEDGRSPRFEVDVVIVKASPHLSKVWYETGYVEGSNAPPDCWSVDGRKPDPASPKLQNPTCAGCKWNAWGSSRTQGGSGKGKDCADSKRFAIVPYDDIENERFGGPMLLRVPPASLAEVLTYANSLQQIGFPYNAVATKIFFDVNAEYPKLMFQPIEALSDEDAETILKLEKSEIVERILAAPVDEVHTDGVDTTHTQAAAPAQTPQQTPQVAPQQAPKPTAPPAQVAQPKPATPAPTPAGNVVSLDPNADKRKALRALGTLTEDQITAALGPEPKPEPAKPVEDPRIAPLRAAGLTDEQIKAALGVQAKPAAAPAPAPSQAGVTPRKRRTRAEMDALRAAQAAAPVSNGTGNGAANGAAHDEPELPFTPEPEPAPPTTSSLPADFENLLDTLTADQK